MARTQLRVLARRADRMSEHLSKADSDRTSATDSRAGLVSGTPTDVRTNGRTKMPTTYRDHLGFSHAHAGVEPNRPESQTSDAVVRRRPGRRFGVIDGGEP